MDGRVGQGCSYVPTEPIGDHVDSVSRLKPLPKEMLALPTFSGKYMP